MINKLRPHAAQLLVDLKKSIPAVLLLGSLSLVSAPAARAQITFSIDEFTANTLTFTLHPGVLATTNGAGAEGAAMTLVDIGNLAWANGSFLGVGGGGAFGTASQDGYALNENINGDYAYLTWNAQLDASGGLAAPLTYSFTGLGAFEPTAITTFALYWGNPFAVGTFQSSGPAVTGGGSYAVPEPAAYGIYAGVAMLGLAATRRRRTAR